MGIVNYTHEKNNICMKTNQKTAHTFRLNNLCYGIPLKHFWAQNFQSKYGVLCITDVLIKIILMHITGLNCIRYTRSPLLTAFKWNKNTTF